MNIGTFSTGRIVQTQKIYLRASSDTPFYVWLQDVYLLYLSGDWGDMSDEDKKLNDEALKSGNDRIFASYTYPKDETVVWIITEADRSVTTILFPEEY